MLSPFSYSYKYFRNAFFKISIMPTDKRYFFNGDTPKFPLYWTRDPVCYNSWPRSPMIGDDKKMFNTLDKLL